MIISNISLEHLLIAGILAAGLRWLILLHTRHAGVRRMTTHEYVNKMARVRECSVYDIFLLAAREWRISRQRVESDFKAYLLEDLIPYYVTDLIRKNRTAIDSSREMPLLMGPLH